MLQLQHRHDQPGHPNAGASEKWWHDVNHVHSKYPTAHDVILGTREFTPGTRAKVKPPVLSFNEYGEPLTPEDVDPALALYVRPPEYEEAEVGAAVEEATAVIMDAAEAPVKARK